MRKGSKSVACAWLFFSALMALSAAVQAIEVTRSLAADAALAAQQGKPLLLFVTQPGCPYCERARHEYLRHLAVDPAYTARAMFRELSIGASLEGFDGQRQSGQDAARGLGVRLYPTIVIVDAMGKQLAAPLRGFSADFYAPTIEGRISDAQQALKARK